MKTRAQALTELGEQTVPLAASMAQLWHRARGNLADPVAVDQFALQAEAVAQALVLLAERSHQLAEELLDQEPD